MVLHGSHSEASYSRLHKNIVSCKETPVPSDNMTDRDCCSDTEVVVVKEGREHRQ